MDPEEPQQPPVADVPEQDEEILQEIRDQYSYYDDCWRDIRDARNIDMRYIAGDPWEPEDRQARKDAGRPCISQDELGQYVNQCVNSVRQNKRGIKVDPQGEGSNDKTAELRQDLIRTIEYRSKGPSIYCGAFQSMVEGSYAFFRISRRYINEDGDQEIIIRSIPNPNSVLFDPDCKEPDWSDGLGCFVLEPVKKKRFQRLYPKAQIRDFSAEHAVLAKDWIKGEDILTAEYWKVIVEEREGKPDERSVVQYITNGIEILKKVPQPGRIIPIIPMIGLERYLDKGGRAERVLFSLIRLARDPQMGLAYLVSQEAEEAGLSPKVPYRGWKGQFESARQAWTDVTKIPQAFLEADIPENWPGGMPIALPEREQFTPNFQSFEVAIDSKRRAIQSAMGIVPLPTAAQRNNEKSGVALDRIQNEQAIGSYHFIDGFDRAVSLAGRVIESWIPVVYDTEREMSLLKADESRRKVRINTKQPYPDEKTGQPVHYPIDDAEHDTSVSTGPSYDSQRDAVSDFLDLLIGELPKLPIAPPQAAKLLALSIQMKNLGPKGDEMAELISPTDNGQQQAAQFQQAQAQLQQAQSVVQELQAELQKLVLEKQGKVVENQFRLEVAKMHEENVLTIERLKIDAQVVSAEITTKAQALNERMKFIEDFYQQLHSQGHEIALQLSDQAHEQGMAQQQQQAAAQQQQAAADQQQQQPDQEQQAA